METIIENIQTDKSVPFDSGNGSSHGSSSSNDGRKDGRAGV